MMGRMAEIPDGFYPDPLDPSVMREWAGGRWTVFVESDGERQARPVAHVSRSLPRPGDASVVVVNAPQPAQLANPRPNPALAVAIVWAIAAAIIGAVFIFGTQDQAYGGAAYTGIQNTGAGTVRALGWLIIATGPLGIIVALANRGR